MVGLPGLRSYRRRPSSRPSLVFVNLHYHPDVAAAGQRLRDLVEYLAEGHRAIEVIAGTTPYVRNGRPVRRSERLGGVRITRVTTPRFAREGFIGRMIGYAFFLFRVAALLAFRRRHRVVFLTSPPLLPVSGYLLRRLGLGPPYAIWTMDLHPEAELAIGLLLPDSLATRALESLDRKAFSQADFVVALGSPMQERIRAKGVEPDRLHTVPIWADARELRPISRSRNPLLRELGLEGKFVVSYSGNAGLMHQFSTILAAIERLADSPDIDFVFIGGGPRRSEIEAFARERGLGNLRYLDYFPREKLRFSLSLGDVHLACLRQGAAGISVPAKLYAAMAVGRPIVFIGPTGSETAQAILESECGIVIDPVTRADAARSLADLLRRWQRDPAELRRLGDNGRAAFLERFERKHNCARMERIIRSHWGSALEVT